MHHLQGGRGAGESTATPQTAGRRRPQEPAPSAGRRRRQWVASPPPNARQRTGALEGSGPRRWMLRARRDMTPEPAGRLTSHRLTRQAPEPALGGPHTLGPRRLPVMVGLHERTRSRRNSRGRVGWRRRPRCVPVRLGGGLPAAHRVHRQVRGEVHGQAGAFQNALDDLDAAVGQAPRAVRREWCRRVIKRTTTLTSTYSHVSVGRRAHVLWDDGRSARTRALS